MIQIKKSYATLFLIGCIAFFAILPVFYSKNEMAIGQGAIQFHTASTGNQYVATFLVQDGKEMFLCYADLVGNTGKITCFPERGSTIPNAVKK